MDKRVTFTTKTVSKKEQEARFLAMSPSERFDWFVRCLGSGFGKARPKEDNGNFVVTKNRDAVR